MVKLVKYVRSPRSFSGLIQIYSEKAATSLEIDAFGTYLIPVVWSDFTEGRRGYPDDPGYTLLGPLPVRIAEMKANDRDLEVDKSVFL